MDFSGIMDSVISFAQNNAVIAIIVALGLLFFLYRKPKLFFILVFLCLFLAGLYYVITSMSGSGSAQKKKFLQDEQKQSDSIR